MEAEVQQHPVELGNVFAAITGAFSLDAPVRNTSEASLKEWEADAVPGFLAALLNILEHCKDEARSVPPSCMVHVKGDVDRAIKDNTLSHCSMIRDDACELVCGDHIWDPPWQHRKLERYLLKFPGCQNSRSVLQSIRLLAAVVAKNSVGSSWRKTLGTREWSRVPSDEKAGVRTSALRLLFSEPSDRVATQLGMLITNIARCSRSPRTRCISCTCGPGMQKHFFYIPRHIGSFT